MEACTDKAIWMPEERKHSEQLHCCKSWNRSNYSVSWESGVQPIFMYSLMRIKVSSLCTMIKFHDELGRKMITLKIRTNLLSMSTPVICKRTCPGICLSSHNCFYLPHGISILEALVSFQMKVIQKWRYTLFTLLQEGILPAVTQHTMYAYKLLHFAKTSQQHSTKSEKQSASACCSLLVVTVCLLELGFTSLHWFFSLSSLALVLFLCLVLHSLPSHENFMT